MEPELAHAVRWLAYAGNRTVSREVAQAIRDHVSRSRAELPPANPAERRETQAWGSRLSPARAGNKGKETL